MELFIMRGVSCSGKDTLVNHLFPKAMVISSDDFRVMVHGSISNQNLNSEVFSLVHEVIEKRLSHRVSTVYNATNLKFKDTRPVLEIAKKWGFKVTIINIEPLPLEQLQSRAKERFDSKGILTNHIERHLETYNTVTPEYKRMAETYSVRWIDVNVADTIEQIAEKIEPHNSTIVEIDSATHEVYCIGDVHGCLTELKELVSKINADAEANKKHPVIYILGDLIDRGPEFFNLLMYAKQFNLVLGNHEWLFVREMNNFRECRSQSRAITHQLFSELTERQKNKVKEVIFSMKTAQGVSFNSKTYILTHAPVRNIESIFKSANSYEFRNWQTCTMNGETNDYSVLGAIDCGFEVVNVHGHQSWTFTDIEGQLKAQEGNKVRSINIDSQCVFGGKLTAIRLSDECVFSVQSSVNVDKTFI